MDLYAHTPNASGQWHELAAHLESVATLAEAFADPFDSGDAAWWAGMLHDAGKAGDAFQQYLKLCYTEPSRSHGKTDHKGAGFLRALELCQPLALLIQCHHGGLRDAQVIQDGKAKHEQQRQECERALRAYDMMDLIPLDRAAPRVAAWALQDSLAFEFWLRMLFSALVDADHLDSERHRNPEDADLRLPPPPAGALWQQFAVKQDAFISSLDDIQRQSSVNRVRAEVYAACLAAAEREPGFFRLTVPTGGGKTRSGLAFALKHAEQHGLRHIVTAVPYLTITDQTAAIVHDIFPDERLVLEHHSAAGASEDDDEGSENPREQWRRLAAQNWDAPIVITTMVQLFESLLGRRTTTCRKLHRLAKSVIILDEAQTIPLPLREPAYDVLRELVTHYGTSVVLCTATQPALDTLPAQMRPIDIVPEPGRHFSILKRVEFTWPPPDAPRWTWEDAAERMRASPRALAVVNTVPNARALFAALGPDDGHFHLSAAMCGAHRRDVLAIVRDRLKRGKSCRLVSTQVIEAGVDVDFPLLLRAFGPLDRIVQAAGRCNREGRLDGLGQVIIFDPEEGGVPPGPFRTGTQTTSLIRELWAGDGELDLDDPSTMLTYFTALNKRIDPDRPKIQVDRRARNYETVANNFKMIEDDQVSVIVRYRGLGEDGQQETRDRIDQIVANIRTAHRNGNPGWLRSLFRRAQPYIVSLRHHQLRTFAAQGDATELTDELWLWESTYDPHVGILPGRMDAGNLVV